MTKHAKDLKPGERIALPPMTVEHVIVIGPLVDPDEVWLADTEGHVHTVDPCGLVELDAA